MNDKSSVDLSFTNLSYSVTNWRGSKKEILHSISGYFPSGSLIAILGPSGAGKSTLLNVLSGFKTSKHITGNIFTNGAPRRMEDFTKISCYITQDNDLNELLTVEENLKFAADFKLGKDVSEKEKDDMVHAVLDVFGLKGVRRSKTADISGGQMKRLSVALELVDNPAIVFLDEPTTGLDSFTSQRCLEYFSKLAKYGKTIICTIHQPSATMLKLFDIVYVMSAGNCVYHGKTEQIVPFLDHVGLPCNVHYNPADYIVELANYDYGKESVEVLLNASENGKNFVDSPDASSKINKFYDSSIFAKIDAKEKKESFTYEMSVMLRREYTKLKRHLILTYLRIGAVFLNTIMVTTCFYDISASAHGMNVLYVYNSSLAMIANLCFAGTLITLLVFPKEVCILKKEHFNRYYSIITYYLSITLLDIPISLFTTCGSMLIYYYFAGMSMEAFRIWMVLGISICVSFVSQTIGLLIGAIFKDFTSGVFFGANFHVPVVLFSGFGARFIDIPWYFQYVASFCYLKYAVMSMNAALLGYDRYLDCNESEFCYFQKGETFLNFMGIVDKNFWSDFMVLWLFYFVLRILTYYILLKRVVRY